MPQRPVGPFGGAADYDSGWVDVAAGETRVFRHDLGGDPDDYVVDLTAVSLGFIAQAPFSQEGFGGDTFWDGQKLVEQGYAWHSLDSSQVKVTLGAGDVWKLGERLLAVLTKRDAAASSPRGAGER
jgi:hypothetical protein